MPVSTDIVGFKVGPFNHQIDARWTMSYSASLGDTDPCYLDTRRTVGATGASGADGTSGTAGADGIVAHPLFPVCVEWPTIVASRTQLGQWGITPDETQRTVHATHDTTVHRLVRPGDLLTTLLTYTGAEQRKPGAYSTMCVETVDASGQPVSTTHQGSIHLGTETVGENRPDPAAPAALELGELPPTPLADISVPVAANAAHNYTEGARIWNPIHTDAAVAEKAGLPAIILHGTATLALGVSAVLRYLADGEDDGGTGGGAGGRASKQTSGAGGQTSGAGGQGQIQPEQVRRICGRFGAMVLMPSTVTVRIHDIAPLDVPPLSGDQSRRAVRFQVLTEGDAAVDQGVIVLGH